MEPRPTILIADDTPSHLRLMELLLSREGYDVVTVEDGKAVLDHLRDHTPDLLVLDVDMPFVSGVDLCSRARGVGRLARVPVVLVSAQPPGRVRDQVPWVRADAFVEKPLRFEAFTQEIKALLHRRLAA